MLLRIIDQAPGGAGSAVKVSLDRDGTTESFVADYEIARPTENLRKGLKSYYADHPLHARAAADHVEVVARLIRYGQILGDDLIGSLRELDGFRQAIEQEGYSHLDVELVSSSAAFWSRPWEALILPGSRYILSSVARSFVRRVASNERSAQPTQLRYGLKVSRPAPDGLAHLMQGNSVPAEASMVPAEDDPLRILFIVSRPRMMGEGGQPSLAFDASCDALSTEGALAYEIWHACSWSDVAQRLASPDDPIHIVHFDGPVCVTEGCASLVLSDRDQKATPIAVSLVAQALAEGNVGLLSIDARGYWSDGAAVPAFEGLLKVAQDGLQAGLANVLGLQEISDPWTSGECFREVYRGCARGLDLGQAVVEARKTLQSKTAVSRFTAHAIPFHSWPLLTHYGDRAVLFFCEPHAVIDPRDSERLKRTGQKLFGFRAAMLPPLLPDDADGQLLAVVDHVRNRIDTGSPIAIGLTGSPGTGKTHLVHRACWHLAQTEQIHYGFYFDFARDFYSASDMLAMIAPVLSVAPQDASRLQEKLNQLRCGFVLDGFLDEYGKTSQQDVEAFAKIERLFSKLLQHGHVVLVTGRAVPPQVGLQFAQWTTEPLSGLEHRALAARTLRLEKLEHIEDDESWRDLLASLRGNAWLTTKALPLLHSRPPLELVRHIREKVQWERPNSLVEDFLDWQWDELPRHCQLLLLMCMRLEGVYLEILSVACDQEESFLPARTLMTNVGSAEAKFADVVQLWERHGFVNKSTYGRVVDSRALPFLQGKQELPGNGADEHLQLCFSRCLCEGIRLVTKGILAQPTSGLSHHLLANRGQWVSHFERLWFAADYKAFGAVVQVFEQLLKQARLEPESAAWMLDLLGRSDMVKPGESAAESQTGWLALASKTLALDESLASKTLTDGAQMWWKWFQVQGAQVDEADVARFKQVANFLESYFQKCGDWAHSVAVCEKLYPVLMDHEAWRDAIQALQSLARHQLQLGDAGQAYATENKILDEIPYEDSPPGVRERSMLGVLLARVSRGVAEQGLLDRLRALDAERGGLESVLDGVQADIYYQQGRHGESMPFYCKLWQQALGIGQSAQLEKLRARFRDLEGELGTVSFSQYLDSCLAQGVARPTA